MARRKQNPKNAKHCIMCGQSLPQKAHSRPSKAVGPYPIIGIMLIIVTLALFAAIAIQGA